MLLNLQHVSLAFGHLPLLDAADLRVEPGERVALIGRNGTGKSSLLRVVSGELAPDSGTVWRAPGITIARLDQEVPSDPGDRTVVEEVARGLERLRAGEDSWHLEQRVKLAMSRLDLPAERKVRDLSGGWRRRVLLGQALVSQPDLLLLDEPTNHLDIEAIRWVETLVSGFSGTVLFVTHDRAFLARLATRIVELDRGRVTSWPGAYPAYVEKKAAALENEARDLERLDQKLAQEEAWLRQGVKARRTRNEGRVRDLMKLRAERASRRAQVGEVRMTVDASDGSGKLVFEAKNVVKRFGGRTVVAGYSQRVLRGDRVGLIGPNGSGKSTLLRLLVGELEPDEGSVRRGSRLQVAYFDQQRQQLDPERTVAETVNDGNSTVIVNGQPRHVNGYLADFLFPKERARSPVKALSGGERNRLLLARLFARPANVLVLDEPTNDLDIETLELLEELVAEFDGTVLLVSHDRVFLDRVVTSTLAFDGSGRVIEYVGGYDDYLRQSRAAVQTSDKTSEGLPAEGEDRAASSGRARRPRRLTYKEQRELDALPSAIDALETEQVSLQDEIASPEFYKAPAAHIHHTLARVEDVKRALDEKLERWMALEQIKDGTEAPEREHRGETE